MFGFKRMDLTVERLKRDVELETLSRVLDCFPYDPSMNHVRRSLTPQVLMSWIDGTINKLDDQASECQALQRRIWELESVIRDLINMSSTALENHDQPEVISNGEIIP